jgi:hypothetical protein
MRPFRAFSSMRVTGKFSMEPIAHDSGAPHWDLNQKVRLVFFLAVVVALIVVNVWPVTSSVGVGNLGVFGWYSWQSFGWPAAYCTQERSWGQRVTERSVEELESVQETEFSGAALVLNIVVAITFCGLAWSAGSLPCRWRLSLRELFFVVLCVAVFCAAWTRVSSVGLNKTPPWAREIEWESACVISPRAPARSAQTRRRRGRGGRRGG